MTQEQSLHHRKTPSSLVSATMTPTASLPNCMIGDRKERKRVTFSEEARMRVYDRTTMLQDKANLWYSEDEIRKQRRYDIQMIARIRRAAPSFSISTDTLLDVLQTLEKDSSRQHQSTWDIRGLESLIDGGYRKARTRLNCVLAVLMEQDRQDFEGDYDDCKIAMRYERCSKASLTSAYRNAQHDRKAIETSNSTYHAKGYSLLSSDFPVCVDAPVVNTLPSRAA